MFYAGGDRKLSWYNSHSFDDGSATTPTPPQRKELAAFLRSQREAADPAAFGLRLVGRRRTPGLRREELAQLCGVSVTWYTWLEQARDIGVSREVFERIARALRMSKAERAHLFALAGLQRPASFALRDAADGLLRKLVDALDPNPAYVINPWWDLLAYNRAYATLLGGLDHRPADERNAIWLMFMDPRVRATFEDWPIEARRVLGQLRAHLALYPSETRGRELIDQMKSDSREFAEIWAERKVSGFESARKRLRAVDRRRLEIDYVKLAVTADERQHLLVFLPADKATAERLRQLALATHGVSSSASGRSLSPKDR